MRPDEKSVMAYVAFFWKEFAANKRKNLAAERIGTVVAREQSFLQLQEQYTAQATELSQWLQEREAFFKKEAEGNSMGEVEKVEAFDADDSLTKLYKRGRSFYVMGNTELALRHFREALKLDPEHQDCKTDYKQAKKLSKILEKIEAVMGKDIEGKGRAKSLERVTRPTPHRVLL